MKIVECRVIRPKDRRSVVLATAELLFDNGIRVVNMHLLKPREGDEGSQLRMPVVHTKSGMNMNPFNPCNPEFRAVMHKAVEETLAEAVEQAKANSRRGLLVCGSEAIALEAEKLLENR